MTTDTDTATEWHYRITVEHDLPYDVQGTEKTPRPPEEYDEMFGDWSGTGRGPYVQHFLYARVSAGSIEEAVEKVRRHHVAKYGEHLLEGIRHTGFTIGGQEAKTPYVLRSFTKRDRGGYEWSIGLVWDSPAEGTDTEHRTDSRGQGHWTRQADHAWKQDLGHLQYSLPADAAQARAALCRRHGLTDLTGQGAS